MTPPTEHDTRPTDPNRDGLTARWRRLPRRNRRLLAGAVALWAGLSLVTTALLGPDEPGPDPIQVSVTELLDAADDQPELFDHVTLDDAARRARIHLTADAIDADALTGPVDPGDPGSKMETLDGHEAGDDAPEAITDYPIGYGGDLLDALRDAGLDVTVEEQHTPSMLTTILPSLIPMLLIIGFLWYFIIRKGGSAVGKLSRGDAVDVPDTHLDDVAGIDEVVDELSEIVDYLHDPGRYERAGATVPKGVLLEGPPGVGKTLIARAVAGEAGVPFFAIAGSDFVETYVGVGAQRVRDLFRKARKQKRAIIFVDEIDAIGKARSDGPGNGATEERESTLNALLVEMDGFEASNVIVIAATNRADMLDSALLRPGRFDRRIAVGAPDIGGREKILRLHARSRQFASDVDWGALARRTVGMTGADLAKLVNESAIRAARRHHTVIDAADVAEALAHSRLGRERRSAIVSEADRRITAWHEAGHALAALWTDAPVEPHAVSIVPRGVAGGVTWMEGVDSQYLTRSGARDQLVVMCAGRAAEILLLDGDHTSGAASDLAQATKLARDMVLRWGMNADNLIVRDGKIDRDTEATVNRLLVEARDRAVALLEANRDALDRVAHALLEAETIDGHELRDLAGPAAAPAA